MTQQSLRGGFRIAGWKLSKEEQEKLKAENPELWEAARQFWQSPTGKEAIKKAIVGK